MIDLRLLRDDPDLIRESLRRRGLDLDVDRLVELEAQARGRRQEAEELRARQRDAGRLIAPSWPRR
jgi:seryl-tRNA synthetase